MKGFSGLTDIVRIHKPEPSRQEAQYVNQFPPINIVSVNIAVPQQSIIQCPFAHAYTRTHTHMRVFSYQTLEMFPGQVLLTGNAKQQVFTGET